MKKTLDSTALKAIACVLMFADHVHQMFIHVGAPDWLTWLGRPVFILFLFTSAEAFHHTRSRSRYIRRLGIAAVALSVGFFALPLLLPNPNVMLTNNAFATFFIAALYMLFADRLIEGIKARDAWKIVSAALLCLIPVISGLPVLMLDRFIGAADSMGLPMWMPLGIALAIPSVFTAEGGALMIGIGVAFYLLRGNRWAQVAALAAASLYVFIVSWPDLLAQPQWMMVFAAIPMLMYNGQKGRGMKSFFYIFYPAHIVGLYLVSTLVFR
ncbi:MAG: conjugal transfer protein TraX [Oscillospiraceae bacterium]|jgi:hypothetical protein|nr:conjugal transfer protein TraX [Oscillospiraceae bacterium]